MISKFSKRKRERLKEIEEKLRELERKEEISGFLQVSIKKKLF